MMRMQRCCLLVLVFAVSSRAEQADKKDTPLTAKQLEALWTDLGQNDDAGTQKALQGIQAMVRAPKLALPFLKERCEPVAGPDAKMIDQLITDLDGKDFKTREKAAKELEKLGPFVGPALDRKLREQLPLEVRRRVESLIEKTERQTLSADELRVVRGIEVLRDIGSPEAVEILKALAKGAEGAVPTVLAKEAVTQLTPRAK